MILAILHFFPIFAMQYRRVEVEVPSGFIKHDHLVDLLLNCCFCVLVLL